jgi:hypothetical protein
MDGMTKEEAEEYQERLSKLHAGAPETLAYPTRQRVQLLASLIADRIAEDQKSGAPLLREIERQNKKSKAAS